MGTSFGQVIPVTGPNIGFDGSVSRLDERVITARQVLPTGLSNVAFAAPCVIIPNSSGGGDTMDSIADFIATSFANAGLVAAQFGGFAVREVKTQVTYPAGVTPGIQQVGYYVPGEMGEILERGSMTVPLAAGVPLSQGQVYTRLALNSAVPGGTVGDIEAAPPSSDTISTTGTASSGSTALTVASGTGLKAGQSVSGAGIAPGTSIAAVTGTAVTLSLATTAALSATPVVFSNVVALPNCVFRTGFVDANNKVEITLKIRNAA
jgi:hypothetical protein